MTGDADKKLEEESIEKFSLRPYQQNAVLSVESGLRTVSGEC